MLAQHASLLGQAYDSKGHPAVAQKLAEVLTALGTSAGDPGLLIEASALYEDADQAEPGASQARDFRNAWVRVQQAQGSAYKFTHDPGSAGAREGRYPHAARPWRSVPT